MRAGRWATALVGLVLLLPGCGGEGRVDWSAPENLLLREKSAKVDSGAELDYWSLIDAPCKAVYDALADVEHYAEFIPGVDSTQLLGVTGETKTMLIAQRVIGRQNNAKVEWKLDPAKPYIEFKTLNSDFSFNDGHYDFQPSPDGKRCILHSVFVVKQKEGAGEQVPIGTLTQGTRDAFLAAARGVKKHAAGLTK